MYHVTVQNTVPLHRRRYEIQFGRRMEKYDSFVTLLGVRGRLDLCSPANGYFAFFYDVNHFHIADLGRTLHCTLLANGKCEDIDWCFPI
jgi:hypothetical protein